MDDPANKRPCFSGAKSSPARATFLSKMIESHAGPRVNYEARCPDGIRHEQMRNASFDEEVFKSRTLFEKSVDRKDINFL